jgi:hypothetical protein
LTDTYYKIRHKKTGMYSKGGMDANSFGRGGAWNKSGKVWDTIGKLRSHLTSHLRVTDMSEWEVVVIETKITDVKPVHEMITPERLMELLKK